MRALLPIIACIVAVRAQTDEIIMIAEVWRHGARSPGYNSLKEEWVDQIGTGNLIPNGMRAHYVLGQMVRDKYKHLFSEQYNGRYAKCYSSDYDRTIQSGIAHMMGIYPQGTGYNTSTTTEKIINPPFNHDKSSIKFSDNFALPGGYNPVPIRVRDKATDTVFMKNEEVTCPWVPRL